VAENLRIACELSELTYLFSPWRFEPGVYKLRSIEEAEQHRQRQRLEQVRKRRRNSPAS